MTLGILGTQLTCIDTQCNFITHHLNSQWNPPEGYLLLSEPSFAFTANSENLVSARAQKIKKPGHSKKEMASIKGKRKADASCS